MPYIVSIVLLVLAVVLVVLTRMRLAKRAQRGAGRFDLPRAIVDAHTAVGTIAIAVWGSYLLLDLDRLVGVIGLVLWWIVTVIGLLILSRWLPAGGRHASDGAGDSWTQGPWLSMVAHLGALAGAIAWTTFFALGSI